MSDRTTQGNPKSEKKVSLEDLFSGRVPEAGQIIVRLLLNEEARPKILAFLAGALRSESSRLSPVDTSPLLLVLRAQRRLLGATRESLMRDLASLGLPVVEATAHLIPRCKDKSDLHLLLDLARVLANPHLLSVLHPLLDSEDRVAAILALQAIATIDDERARRLLIESISRPHLRWSAVAFLAERKITSALRDVVNLLGDPSPEVRKEVIRALVIFDDPRVIPALKQVLSRDKDHTVRAAAAEAITRLSQRHGLPLDGREFLVLASESARSGRLIDRILAEARAQGASDVHLFPSKPVCFRIHGNLVEREPKLVLSSETVEKAILEVLPEHLKGALNQDFQADFSYAIPGLGRHRVNCFAERRGLAAVIRLIPREVPTLASLGLPPQVKEVASLSQGLVIITGRSGSGKTSTLAALVNLINESRAVHIITLEDPIEFVHMRKKALINQREIGRHAPSFPLALRSALREDPDVIVVGEVRDLETARLVVEAAETGHLVLATLHTPDTASAIERLIDSFPAVEQQQVRLMVADSIKMVLAQTLIPRADSSGRVGCFEVLLGTQAVSNLIKENKVAQIPGILQTGRSLGMCTFDMSLMDLLKARLITAEEAYLRAMNKEPFRPFVGTGEDEGRQT